MQLKLKILPLTVFLSAFLCLNLSADKGFTESQSVKKFGDPVGRAESSKLKILYFETPEAKITETFNTDGICIESIKQYKTVNVYRPNKLRPKIRVTQQNPAATSKPVTTFQPIRSSPNKIAQVNNINTRKAAIAPIRQKTLFGEITDSIFPITTGIVLVSIALALMLYFFTKEKPIPEEESDSKKQVRALFEFTKRKYDNPLKDRKVNKDENSDYRFMPKN